MGGTDAVKLDSTYSLDSEEKKKNNPLKDRRNWIGEREGGSSESTWHLNVLCPPQIGNRSMTGFSGFEIKIPPFLGRCNLLGAQSIRFIGIDCRWTSVCLVGVWRDWFDIDTQMMMHPQRYFSWARHSMSRGTSWRVCRWGGQVYYTHSRSDPGPCPPPCQNHRPL